MNAPSTHTHRLILLSICITANVLLFVMIMAKSTSTQSVSAQTVEAIPAGTLSSFNLASCPTGWSEYTAARGRMLLGVNPSQYSNAPYGQGNISVRSRLSVGGAEVHTLTANQLPLHAHSGSTADPAGFATAQAYVLAAATSGYGALAATSGTRWGVGGEVNVGGGQSHNNYAPMIALLFCEKN